MTGHDRKPPYATIQPFFHTLKKDMVVRSHNLAAYKLNVLGLWKKNRQRSKTICFEQDFSFIESRPTKAQEVTFEIYWISISDQVI